MKTCESDPENWTDEDNLESRMYLSDRQVAERYGVSRGTPWRWVKTDAEFPSPIELTSGCTRWRLEDLVAWENSRTQRSSHEAADSISVTRSFRE